MWRLSKQARPCGPDASPIDPPGNIPSKAPSQLAVNSTDLLVSGKTGTLKDGSTRAAGSNRSCGAKVKDQSMWLSLLPAHEEKATPFLKVQSSKLAIYFIDYALACAHLCVCGFTIHKAPAPKQMRACSVTCEQESVLHRGTAAHVTADA